MPSQHPVRHGAGQLRPREREVLRPWQHETGQLWPRVCERLPYVMDACQDQDQVWPWWHDRPMYELPARSIGLAASP